MSHLVQPIRRLLILSIFSMAVGLGPAFADGSNFQSRAGSVVINGVPYTVISLEDVVENDAAEEASGPTNNGTSTNTGTPNFSSNTNNSTNNNASNQPRAVARTTGNKDSSEEQNKQKNPIRENAIDEKGWVRAIDEFDKSTKNKFVKSRASRSVFDGSRTYKEGKFTVVEMRYPLDDVISSEEAQLFLKDRVNEFGASLIGQRMKNKGKTLVAQFIVPNEMTAHFAADQKLRHEANWRIRKSPSGEYLKSIPLVVRLHDLDETTRKKLGANKDGYLQLFVSSNEYRGLFQKGPFRKAMMRPIKLKQLIAKRSGYLNHSEVPDIDLNSINRYEKLEKKTNVLVRLWTKPRRLKRSLRDWLFKGEVHQERAEVWLAYQKAQLKQERAERRVKSKNNFKLSQQKARTVYRETYAAKMAEQGRAQIKGLDNTSRRQKRAKRKNAAKAAQAEFNKVMHKANIRKKQQSGRIATLFKGHMQNAKKKSKDKGYFAKYGAPSSLKNKIRGKQAGARRGGGRR